jgi:hypothetical protein
MNRIILVALALTLAALPVAAHPKEQPPEPAFSDWNHWLSMKESAPPGSNQFNHAAEMANKAFDVLLSKGWCFGPGINSDGTFWMAPGMRHCNSAERRFYGLDKSGSKRVDTLHPSITIGEDQP